MSKRTLFLLVFGMFILGLSLATPLTAEAQGEGGCPWCVTPSKCGEVEESSPMSECWTTGEGENQQCEGDQGAWIVRPRAHFVLELAQLAGAQRARCETGGQRSREAGAGEAGAASSPRELERQQRERERRHRSDPGGWYAPRDGLARLRTAIPSQARERRGDVDLAPAVGDEEAPVRRFDQARERSELAPRDDGATVYVAQEP